MLEAFWIHTPDFRYFPLVDAQRPERCQAGATKYVQAREAETLAPSVLREAYGAIIDTSEKNLEVSVVIVTL